MATDALSSARNSGCQYLRRLRRDGGKIILTDMANVCADGAATRPVEELLWKEGTASWSLVVHVQHRPCQPLRHHRALLCS